MLSEEFDANKTAIINPDMCVEKIENFPEVTISCFSEELFNEVLEFFRANVIYNKLLSDKLEANLGYIYENAVAQMLVARGNNLFYYTMESDTSNHLYEIDFLLSKGDKINPIEVKSGNYRWHKSLDMFCDKYSSRIRDKYVVHTKDYKWENGIHYLPVYMIPFL